MLNNDLSAMLSQHYITYDVNVVITSRLPERSGMARVLKGSHSVTCTLPAFIHWRNEPYLPLPSQPRLVLIYRPGRNEYQLRL